MRKKHPIRRAILILLLLAMVAGLAALPMLTANQAEETHKAAILSTVAERRTLERYLSYGAPLEPQKASQVCVPSGVEVTAFLVANGDSVKAGDPVARVDDVSVMTAVRQVQESLDEVANRLKETKVTPGVITVDENNVLCSDGKPIEESKLSDYLHFITLSQQHRDYEEILLELFHLHMDGVVTAPCDGLVSDVDKTQIRKLSASGTTQMVLLAVNTPAGEDDDVPHYCYVGRIEAAQGSQWLLRRGSDVTVTDFLDLSGLDTTLTNEVNIFDSTGFTVFRYAGESWSVSGAQAGDAVLIDEQTGWIVVIGSSTQPPEETEPEETEPEESEPEETEPGETEPGETEPTQPGNKPGRPSIPSVPSGGIDISRFLGGMQSGKQQEDTLYSTEKTQLAMVTPMDTMRLTLNVDEMDISQLAPGMTAQVTVEALPNRDFTAQIVEVSQFGTNAGGSSKFAVTLELPCAEGMLPGMNARVKPVLGTLPDCLTIPVAALVEQGNRTLVYTGYDEKTQTLLEPAAVEVGASDGEYAQILSGLTQGQTIWYGYYDKVEISHAVEKKGMFG